MLAGQCRSYLLEVFHVGRTAPVMRWRRILPSTIRAKMGNGLPNAEGGAREPPEGEAFLSQPQHPWVYCPAPARITSRRNPTSFGPGVYCPPFHNAVVGVRLSS